MINSASPDTKSHQQRRTSVSLRLRWAFQALLAITIITTIVALGGTWYTYRQETDLTQSTIRAVRVLHEAASDFRDLTDFSALPDRVIAPDEIDLLETEVRNRIAALESKLIELSGQNVIGSSTKDQFIESLELLQRRHSEGVGHLVRLANLREISETTRNDLFQAIEKAIVTVDLLETDLNLALADRLPVQLGLKPDTVLEQLAALRRLTRLDSDFGWLYEQIDGLAMLASDSLIREAKAAIELRLAAMTAMTLALPINHERKLIARTIYTVQSTAIANGGLLAQQIELQQIDQSLTMNRIAVADLNETIRLTLDTVFADMQSDAELSAARTYSVVLFTALVLIGLAALAIVLVSFAVWRLVLGNIASRLDQLWQQTSDISQGKLDQPVGVAGNDELAALGNEIEQSRQKTLRLLEADERIRVSEERLSLAAGTGNLGILDWTDTSLDKAFFSNELLASLGIPIEQHFASPQRLFEQIHPDDRQPFDEQLSLLGRSEQELTLLCRLRGGDNRWRWYELTIHQQNGSHQGSETPNSRIIMALHDVDEIVETRERLQRQTEDLSRINEELDRFAYVASHDLKSPLRAIADLAGWLEEDLQPVMDDDSRESMRLLSNRAERLIKLLDDLLAFSRLGRPSSAPEQISIDELVRDAFSMAVGAQNFELVIAEPLPILATDSTPLSQVFFNFFANATKHHDQDHGRIEVRSWFENDLVWFSVEDDGPGIEERYHERIFGMFTTLLPRDAVEGSGIGLAIIKKQVSLFGGTVRVESTPLSKRGAKFSFSWKAKSISSLLRGKSVPSGHALT